MKMCMLLAAAALATGPAFANGVSRDGYMGYERLGAEHRDGYGSSSALDRYYGCGGYISLLDRDYRWPERLERDRDGSLSYDRDYPYDFRSRGGRTTVVVAATRYAEPTMIRDGMEADGPVRVHRGAPAASRFHGRD